MGHTILHWKIFKSSNFQIIKSLIFAPMKTIYKLSAFLIVATLILHSCTKEKSLETGGRGVGTTTGGDSTLLIGMAILDPSLPSGFDTGLKATFNYDNLKRITTFSQISTYNSFRYTLSYNGNDTLPYKSYQTVLDSSGPTILIDTIIDFFKYNSLGKMTEDSSLVINGAISSPTAVYVLDFIYGPGGTTMYLKKTYVNSLFTTDTTFSVQTQANSNLLTEIDSSHTTLGFAHYDYTQTYDNHPNPLHKYLGSFNVPLLTYTGDNVFLFADPVSTNNILTQVEHKKDEYGMLTYYNNTYSYVYKTNGYPASVTTTSATQGQTTTYKSIFIYGN